MMGGDISELGLNHHLYLVNNPEVFKESDLISFGLDLSIPNSIISPLFS